MYIVTSKWYVVSDQFDLHTIWWVKGNFCGCDGKKLFTDIILKLPKHYWFGGNSPVGCIIAT